MKGKLLSDLNGHVWQKFTIREKDYDQELQLGIAVWYGFLSSSDFREAIETCLTMMEEYKLLRWLGDNRKLRAIRQADQDWFVESVFPA